MRYQALFTMVLSIASYLTYGQDVVIKDSTTYSLRYTRHSCKNLHIQIGINKYYTGAPKPGQSTFINPEGVKKRARPSGIHGYVQYGALYRSFLDTPYNENDVVQHSVQAKIQADLLGSIPIAALITNRTSNSKYFKNVTDISIQFRQGMLLQKIKSKLLKDIDETSQEQLLLMQPEDLYARMLKNEDSLATYMKPPTVEKTSYKTATYEKLNKTFLEYKQKMDTIKSLRANIDVIAGAQKVVEDREKALRLSTLESIKTEEFPFNRNIAASELFRKINQYELSRHKVPYNYNFAENPTYIDTPSTHVQVEAMQTRMAALQRELDSTKTAYKNLQKKSYDSLLNLKKQIINSKGGKDLSRIIEHNRLKAGGTALEKAMMSVRSVGIGRSFIDYSDLTVKNISIQGVSIEAAPTGYYFAFASGSIDYRFRDFIFQKDRSQPKQYVTVVRGGIGSPEESHIIATYYTGKKAALNSGANPGEMNSAGVTGVAVEGRVNINSNHSLTVEVARSSSSFVNDATTSGPNNSNKVFNFRNRLNEAWAVSTLNELPKTKTIIKGYYRKSGEQFQSFNLNPFGTNQQSWLAQITQPFWRNRIVTEASIRQNDFSSAVAAPDYTSSTVFKAFKIRIQVPKYPFFMVAYSPSSQISITEGNVLYESQFNTLNVLGTYGYTVAETKMSSSLMVTKFYNSSSDSGFIYANSFSWTFLQNLFYRNLTIKGSCTNTVQPNFKVLTVEPGFEFRANEKITVEASLKYNLVNDNKTFFAGMGMINMSFAQLGTIQLSYDKSYMPSYRENHLMPVDIGRITFNRQF